MIKKNSKKSAAPIKGMISVATGGGGLTAEEAEGSRRRRWRR